MWWCGGTGLFSTRPLLLGRSHRRCALRRRLATVACRHRGLLLSENIPPHPSRSGQRGGLGFVDEKKKSVVLQKYFFIYESPHTFSILEVWVWWCGGIEKKTNSPFDRSHPIDNPVTFSLPQLCGRCTLHVQYIRPKVILIELSNCKSVLLLALSSRSLADGRLASEPWRPQG